MKLDLHAVRFQLPLAILLFCLRFWGFLFLFFFKLFSTDLSNKTTVLCCIHPALLPAFNHILVSQCQDQVPFVKVG